MAYICYYFCWKKFAKATHTFSAKIPVNQILYLTRTLNIFTTNELVKRTMLWSTQGSGLQFAWIIKSYFLEKKNRKNILKCCPLNILPRVLIVIGKAQTSISFYTVFCLVLTDWIRKCLVGRKSNRMSQVISLVQNGGKSPMHSFPFNFRKENTIIFLNIHLPYLLFLS